MSRREYASSEVYSERDRESRAPRRHRGQTTELEEVEIRERRKPSAAPDFLREDYGRSEAGQLVIRERERSRERPRRREVEEKEEVIIREKSRERPRRREVVEDEVIVDRGPRRREVIEDEVILDRGPRRREDIREEIVYKERDRSPMPPPQPYKTEREDFEFYRRDDRRREPEPVPYREPAPMPPVVPVRSEREVFEYRPIIREPTPEPERTEITIKEKFRERPRYREERDEEIIIREKSRERPRYREEHDEEIIIREKERERPRYHDDEEIIIREKERERPRYRDERDEEIIIRRDERSRERPRYPEEHDEEIIIRDRERDRPRYRDERDEEIIIRDRERDSLRPSAYDSLSVREDVRTRTRSRGGFEESDALVVRREEGRSRAGSRARSDFREEDITIRERERDRYRERSRSRERDDIIIRHGERGNRHNDEIIIRRNERSPSPESPPPPAPPEPVRAPPIVQEVITHHRHIDHGFERAPEPPRPRSPSPRREERIEIRHRSTDGRRQYDDDIILERESGGRRPLEGVRRGRTEEDLSLVRRTEQDSFGPPVRYEPREPRKDRLWTEITKDLVSEEAMRERGYEYEEAETSWFVMQHLRYEDVLSLTELTEDIRADRRDRISEIQAERDRGPPPFRGMPRPPPQSWDEERIIEREIVYDGPGRPPRRIR